MKDSKFIELLNLYVDHQISAADAALLEAAIQNDPKRRQVYREYCQMQKACAVLADKFRNEAHAIDEPIADFKPRRARLAPFAYASGLAAAACIALVLVNRSPNQDSSTSSGASVAAVQTVAAPATRATAVSVPPKTELPALQPVFQGIVKEETSRAATLAKTDRASLNWMTRVQFERVPVEELRFDSVQPMPVDDLLFRNRRVFDPQTEGAAFRFQK